MDWEYNDRGPLDPTSPFAQAANSAPRSSKSCPRSRLAQLRLRPTQLAARRIKLTNGALTKISLLLSSRHRDLRIPSPVCNHQQNHRRSLRNPRVSRLSCPAAAQLRLSGILPSQPPGSRSMRLFCQRLRVLRTVPPPRRLQTIRMTHQTSIEELTLRLAPP